MAKDDFKPRLLRKSLGWGSLAYEAGVLADDMLGPGWTQGSAGAGWQRSYFDLAGYSLEDKTLFLSQIFSQRITNPHNEISAGDGVFPPMHEILLVSDTYWSDESIQAMLNQIGLNIPPGFLPTAGSSPYEAPSWQSALYGESILYRGDSTLAYASGLGAAVFGITASSYTFGSGGATASDRIYITRVMSIAQPSLFSPGVSPTGVLYIHPINIVIAGLVGEEPDLVYLERLRRSYALEPTHKGTS